MAYNTYDCLVFNPTEQMSAVAANFVWRAVEAGTHYWAMPKAISATYKTTMNYFFDMPKPDTKKPRTWFGLARSAVSKVARFAVPQVISHEINRRVLQPYFWDWANPAVTAFLHPIMMKITPLVKDIFDIHAHWKYFEWLTVPANSVFATIPFNVIPGIRNAITTILNLIPSTLNGLDFSFHWRNFIVGGNNSWFTTAAAPLVGFRNFIRDWVIDDLSAPQKIAGSANQAGQYVAETGAAFFSMIRDIFVSTARVGQCVTSPEAATQCFADSRDYFGAKFAGAWDNSGPAREAIQASFQRWLEWASDKAGEAVEFTAEALQAKLMQGAEFIAERTDLTADQAYIAELSVAAAASMFVGYYALKYGTRMGWNLLEKYLDRSFLPAQQHQHEHNHHVQVSVPNLI